MIIWGYPGVPPNPAASILGRYIQRGAHSPVKLEEGCSKRLQSRPMSQPLEAEEARGSGRESLNLEGAGPYQHLVFGLLTSSPVLEYMSTELSLCGDVYGN